MSRKGKRWLGGALVLLLGLFPSVSPVGPFTTTASAVSASGGSCTQTVSSSTGVTVSRTTIGNSIFCVIRFPQGTRTWTVPQGVTQVDWLIVAGGGGGGGTGSWFQEGGGGGGAGGFLSGTNRSVTPGSSQNITVGAGGRAGTPTQSPARGGDSSALGLTSNGGGRGGFSLNSGSSDGDWVGQSGGSGGGGHGPFDSRSGGSGTSGQGNSGGRGEHDSSGGIGGGGGGAGGAGRAGNDGSGAGGSGKSSDITGSSITFAQGGSGGTRTSQGATPNHAGSGGGGGQREGNSGVAGRDGTVIIRYALQQQAALSFNSPPATLARSATATLTVSGGSGSGAVTYTVVSGPCTVNSSSGVVTASSNSSGACVVRATKAEDSAFLARTVDHTIQVRGTQEITFANPGNKDYSPTAFTVSATSNRNLEVSFQSQTTAVCTVSGSSVTMLRDGTCTIRAFNNGDGTWFGAETNQSFTISRAAQTITFGALDDRTFSVNTFSLSSTASSGLGVQFSSRTPQICSVSGADVTMLKAGLCRIRAAQPGNDTQYLAADTVDQSFSISKANQQISLINPGTKTFGVAPFDITASTNAVDLEPTLSSTTESVCTVSEKTVTVTGAGDCTIRAKQDGDDRYNAATEVFGTFTVVKADQDTVSLASDMTVGFGQTLTLIGSGGSGTGAYSYTRVSGDCSIDANVLTPTAVGECVVRVTRAGDANFNEQTSDTLTITIVKGNQTITFDPPSTKMFGDDPFDVSATTTASGLTPTITSDTLDICTISGNTVTIVSSGDCILIASEDGDKRFEAADPVTRTITVSKATQTISFQNPGKKTFGDDSFDVTVSATPSGLTPTVISTTTDVCTIEGVTVTIVTAGTCSLQATQTGDDRYAAAVPVTVTFSVETAGQTISFAKPDDTPFAAGSTLTLTATSTSNLTVQFASLTQAVCTASGATVTMVSSGTCTISATQPGNDTEFGAAEAVVRSFELTNTVTFISNFTGGPGNTTQQIVSGQETALTANPFTRTGYSFAGWAEEPTGQVVFTNQEEETITLQGDLSLYAVWEPLEYVVAIEAGTAPGAEGQTRTLTKIHDTALVLPDGLDANATFTRPGYTVGGWSVDPDGSSQDFDLGGNYLVEGDSTLYPAWTPDTYTVTLEAGSVAGATGDSVTLTKVHDVVLVLPDSASANSFFAKTGYSITAWSLNEDGSTADFALEGDYTDELPQTLYPVWTPDTYTVTFDYNNATGGNQTASASYTVDSIAVILPTPTKTGFVFGGWFADEALSVLEGLAGSTYRPTSDVVLYAKWTPGTYVVLFDYNDATGGDQTTQASYTTGGTAITLPTPTRNGFTFGGWYSDTALTAVVGQAADSFRPSQNVTVFAKWVAITRNVTYHDTDSSSGTAPVDTRDYIIGDQVVVLANSGNLRRTGYTFEGWVTNPDGTGTPRNVGETITVGTADIDLYPQWAPVTYTITYNLNGGSGDVSAFPTTWTTGSDEVRLPMTGVTKTGFTFDGWQELGQSTKLNVDYMPDFENVTLVARWTIKTITYSFDKGLADGLTITGWPSNSSAQFGQTITLPNLTGTEVTVNGNTFTFVGWDTTDTSFGPGDTLTAGEDPITFTARWTQLLQVQYVFGGGTHSVPGAGAVECGDDGLCLAGQTITLRTAPERPGYEFLGWTNAAGDTQYQAGQAHTVSATEFMFYASWQVINYRFTFNSGGGSVDNFSQDKNIGQTVVLPSPGTRTGYTFAGWSADGGQTLYIQGSSHVVGTTGLAFRAQWIPNVYTVTYDWQGGSATAPKISDSFTVGTGAMTLPTAESAGYSRDGFTFSGWSTSVGGSLVSGFQPTADVVLFAVWADGNFTLTLHPRGGSLPAASQVAVPRGDSTTLPQPTRDNFTFLGWFDSATGGTKVTDANVAFTPQGSATLHARWVQNSLFGVDLAALENASTVTASDTTSVDSTFTHNPSNTSARIQVPSGALPQGTIISVRYFRETSRQSDLIPTSNSFFFALLVSWINGSGDTATVPDTAEGKPITVTLTNPSIKAGAMVYQVIGTSVTELGRATTDGEVTVFLTEDPEIVVAATVPEAPTGVTVQEGDTRLTVSWTPGSTGGAEVTAFTVTADPGGHTCVTATNSCVVESLTNNVEYTFTVTATNSVGTSDASAASAISIPRGQNYTVTWNSMGGSAVNLDTFVLDGVTIDPAVFFSGDTIRVTPPAPTRTGYTLDGWAATEGGLPEQFPYAPGVTENITMFAVWSANTYTVTFDSTGGTSVNPGTFVTDGDIPQQPTDPTRLGYDFAGWATTAGGTPIDFPYEPGVTNDITLFALWTPVSQTITYDSNLGSGSVPDTVGNTESTVTLSTGSGLSRTGYTLAGWNTEAGGGGVSYSLGQSPVMPPGGLTLFAVWAPNTYTVTFNSTGGTTVTPGSFLTAGSVTEPTPPTRTGYTFDGWATTDGGTPVSFPYPPGVTNNITLFAVWTADTYTITFNQGTVSGADGADQTRTKTHDIPLVLPNSVTANTFFTRVGHVVAGWSLNADGSTTDFALGGSFTTENPTTLYPVWELATYQVIFNSQGGTAVAARDFLFGGSVTQPFSPTRSGYTFAGWSMVAGDTSALVTFPYTPGVTENVTLHALWNFAPTPPQPGRGSGAVIIAPLPPSAQSPASQQNLPAPALPRPAQAPVAPNGNGAATALIGGVEQQVTLQPSQNGVRVQAGSVSLGISSQPSQTGVAPGESGSAGQSVPETRIVRSGTTTMTGGGLLPGTMVQLWLPNGQSAPAEIARIPVGSDGTFDTALNFSRTGGAAPLPIGRHEIMISGYDENGDYTMITKWISVAQGDPEPELNWTTRQLPTLDPGQSLATSGGAPYEVTLTVVPDNGDVLIDGSGWTFSLNASAGDGLVEEHSDGARITLSQQGTLALTGEGFEPDTRLDVWLFSEPVLLGSVTVNGEGSAATQVFLGTNNIPLGHHTLQLQGVGQDGLIKAANLGITIIDRVAVVDAPAVNVWPVALIAIALLIAAALFARWLAGRHMQLQRFVDGEG